MGWGQIIGGGEDGLYTVAFDYGVATRDAWVAAIDGWIERMNVEIAEAEAKLIAARDRTAAAETELQDLIGLLSSGGGPDGSAATLARIDIATAKYAQALAAQDAVRIPRDQRIAERTALVAKKNAVEAAVVQEIRQAWCVDFTEDATGYVATIEVPGEDQAILIAPGAREPTAADGALAARELLTPEQVFFNAAILPGWQKWRPTYRKGTLVDVDREGGIATVSLDPATSSAQQLPINQSPTLSNIPVVYMECNARVFEAGDRVVVEFEGQDWSAPRVIGFVDHPKPCVRIRVIYRVNGEDVFDEEFYPGDTAPGYTAPATIDGENDYSDPVDRPFIGWSNGTNTLEHPEFELELPTTTYIINAQYAAVSLEHRWQIDPEYQPPNEQYFDITSNEFFVFVDRYERSEYIGTVTSTAPDAVAAAILGAPSIETESWVTDYVGGRYATYAVGESYTLPDPSTVPIPYPPSGPSIGDFVPGSYTHSATLASGWVVTWTKSIKVDTQYSRIHATSSISAAPP